MKFLDDVKQKAGEFASENATLLLTAGGVIGTVATAVLAGRAGYKAHEVLSTAKAMKQAQAIADGRAAGIEAADIVIPQELTKTEKAMALGPHVIPPVITGTATIAAIVLSHRMSAQKIAGMAAAYGLMERNFSEYKEKVAETITGPKQKKIDEELAQDRVNRTDGHENIVVVEGQVLCFDEPTGRYFHSTMEDIRKAVNTTNSEINNHDHANASFFYEELDMPGTSWTDEVGWNRDRLMDLKYDTVLKGGKPCISIDFKVLPRPDYRDSKIY